MPALHFDKASVLVYDPVALNRHSTRNVLHSLGFRGIATAATCEELTDQLQSDREVDLVFAEVTGSDGDICGLIQKIRQGEVGKNPFAVIIATAWMSASDIVKQVLLAGADDLVVRPFSTNRLMERVRAHIEARKGFVVTSDYIGPDRRRDPNREGGNGLLQVPNSLRAKAANDSESLPHNTAEEIARAVTLVNLEKMRRQAFQLGILANFLEDSLSKTTAEDELAGADIVKALEVSADLARRAEGAGLAPVSEMCRALEEVLSQLRAGMDTKRNLKLLNQVTMAMQVSLDPARGEDEHESELRSAMEKIRARGRTH